MRSAGPDAPAADMMGGTSPLLVAMRLRATYWAPISMPCWARHSRNAVSRFRLAAGVNGMWPVGRLPGAW